MYLKYLVVSLLISSFFNYQLAYKTFQQRLCGEIYPSNASNVILMFMRISRAFSNNTCSNFVTDIMPYVIEAHNLISKMNGELVKFNGSIGI